MCKNYSPQIKMFDTRVSVAVGLTQATIGSCLSPSLVVALVQEYMASPIQSGVVRDCLLPIVVNLLYWI